MKIEDITADLKLLTTGFSAGIRDAVKQATIGGKQIGAALTGGINGQLNQSTKQLSASVQQTTNNFKDMGRIVQGILVSQMFYKAIQAAGAATSAVHEYNASLEQTRVAFKYLLKDAEAGSAFTNILQDIAAYTPYTVTTAAASAKQLLAMGIAAKDVTGVMTLLADSTSALGGSEDVFQRVAYAIGQINASSKLLTQDVRQLINAGIPAWQILREELGLTQAELNKTVKKGLNSQVALDALLNGMQKRYAGAAKEQSKTWKGLMSTLGDVSSQMAALFTEDLFIGMKTKLEGIVTAVSSLLSAGKGFGSGGILEAIFPKDVANDIRLFIANIRDLGSAFSELFKASGPLVGTLFKALLDALSIVTPMLKGFVLSVASIMRYIQPAVPIIRAFATALITWTIAAKIGGMLLGLVTAVKALGIAGAVSFVINMLTAAMAGLAVITGPVAAAVIVIVGALAIVAGAGKHVVQWMNAAAASIANVLGTNFSTILPSKEIDDYNATWKDYLKTLEDTQGGMDDTGDSADKAGKKLKKFLASFDEVHAIPDEKEGGAGGGGFGGFGGLFDGLDLSTDGLKVEQQMTELEQRWQDAIPEPILWAPFEFVMPKWPQLPGPPALPAWSPVLVPLFAWQVNPFPELKAPALPDWAPVRVPVYAWQVPEFNFNTIIPKIPSWAPVSVRVYNWIVDALPEVKMPRVPSWAPMSVQVFNWLMPEMPLEEIFTKAQSAVEKFREGLKNGFNKPMPEVQTSLSSSFRQLESDLKVDVPIKLNMDGLPQSVVTAGANLQILSESAKKTNTHFRALEQALELSKASSFTGKTAASFKGMGQTIGDAFLSSKDRFDEFNNSTLYSWGYTATELASTINAVASLGQTAATSIGPIQNIGNQTKLAFEGSASGAHSTAVAVTDAGNAAMYSSSLFDIFKGKVSDTSNSTKTAKEVQEELNEALKEFKTNQEKAMTTVALTGIALGEYGKMMRESTMDAEFGWRSQEVSSKRAQLSIQESLGLITKNQRESYQRAAEDAVKEELRVDGFYGSLEQKQTAWAAKSLAEQIKADEWSNRVNTSFWSGFSITQESERSKELKAQMAAHNEKLKQEGTFSKETEVRDLTHWEKLKLNASIAGLFIKDITEGFNKDKKKDNEETTDAITKKTKEGSEEVKKSIGDLSTEVSKSMATANLNVSTAASGMESTLSKLKRHFSELSGSISSWWTSFWKGIDSSKSAIAIGFNTVSPVKLPGYANGGIIDKEQIIRAGEGGNREAIIPLQNASAMAPFVDAVADGIFNAMAPLFTQTKPGTGGNDLRPLYVGTLIADERGLRELDRKMRIIKAEEDGRTFND